jgi:hypothetical protein
MPEETKIHYNKTATVFNFLFVVIIVGLSMLLLSNAAILGLLLPLLFMFHFTLFTINFIRLFRKSPPLIISKKGITYNPYKIFISADQIKSISYTYSRKGYIDIALKESISKYDLSKSLFGKIMISGGGLNFSSKTNIKILLHGLDINNEKFKKS